MDILQKFYKKLSEYNSCKIHGEEMLSFAYECLKQAKDPEDVAIIKDYCVLLSDRINNGQTKA